MLETESSSATWTSRTTLPARCAARASRGYWGSVRRRRRVSACAGDSQTLWAGASLVAAIFVGAIFVRAVLGGTILVVDDASTTESLSCLVESGLAWRFFAWSGFAGAGFMRKMTLPFS